jgi:hypothetical protein
MRRRIGRLLVFWDYDTQWGIDADRRRGIVGGWTNGHAEFEGAERLLELHARHGIPACFAVVGAAARPGRRPYHDPGQIRRIHAAGHEIAGHGFQHEWLPAVKKGALLEVLRVTRAALEDCLGAPVTAFVPPYNQPFDYIRRGSISLGERRAVRAERTDLGGLCAALHATGFRFCRVAYRSLAYRLADWVLGYPVHDGGQVEQIGRIVCARLNAPCGFSAPVRNLLERCAARGGLLVVYGHPHSLGLPGPQGESEVAAFLARAGELCRNERLHAVLPRDLATSG